MAQRVMAAADPSAYRKRWVRFGVFEFDLANLKLLRNGRDTGLQQQPAMLLAHLINRSGSVVSREELRNTLWPDGTYVEFDLGLNTTVNRLRRSLRDSASEPRYVETVPKKGYRFIAPLEFVMPLADRDLGAEETDTDLVSQRLAEPEEPIAPLPSPAIRGQLKIAAAISVLLAVFGVLAVLILPRTRPPNRAKPVIRSYLSIPAGHFPEVVTILPGGDQVVYQASTNGVRRLYRRSLDEEDSRLIPDSEGGTQPFFSPDGSEIGFYTVNAIRISSPKGSRDLVSISPDFDLRKAIWGDDQFIYYTSSEQGIWRIQAGGGQPQQVVKPVAGDRGAPFYFPQQTWEGFPPALLLSTNSGPIRRSLAWVAISGDSSPPNTLVARGMGGQVLPTGHLLYYWQGSLFAVPYDSETRRPSGSAIEVLSKVSANGWRGPNASVSKNGTLVYLEREEPSKELLWVDRKGRETALPVPIANYEQAEISPDGRRIALVRRDTPGLWTLWICDLHSGAWTRLLEQSIPYLRCVWSPDSRSVIASAAFGDAQFVNLYRITLGAADAPQRLTEEPDNGQFPGSWSAAANAVLFTAGVYRATQSDVFAVSLDAGRTVRSLVATPGVDRHPAFSPDGRWFAYAVIPLPAAGRFLYSPSIKPH